MGRRNNLVISIFFLFFFIACSKKEPLELFFYFSVSLEDDGKITSYVILKKSISGDTIKHHYRTYDSVNHKLLSDVEDLYKTSQDSVFWLRGQGIGYVETNPLFSSFIVGKCDTTFFHFEKIINCYEGKYDLVLSGEKYIKTHSFLQTRQNITRDIIKRRVYYDADLVPILEENIFPESRIMRMERINHLPFDVSP